MDVLLRLLFQHLHHMHVSKGTIFYVWFMLKWYVWKHFMLCILLLNVLETTGECSGNRKKTTVLRCLGYEYTWTIKGKEFADYFENYEWNWQQKFLKKKNKKVTVKQDYSGQNAWANSLSTFGWRSKSCE